MNDCDCPSRGEAPHDIDCYSQRERMDTMANPGAKQFQQVHITIDVWVDPETADTTAWAVADNVQISARNAVEAKMKEIEAPDHGVEVVVR